MQCLQTGCMKSLDATVVSEAGLELLFFLLGGPPNSPT